MNELQIRAMIQQYPVIEFQDYQRLLEEARLVAERLNQMEVTEDNVKDQKKLLARVNKSVKELNDRRIAIKKEILKPYQDFETQVKEIESIVKEADTRLRDQVRDLEEIEREKKKEKIVELWNDKTQVIEYKEHLKFDSWFEESYLNKSTSMNKVEDYLNDWIERVDKDAQYLSNKGKEYLAEYFEHYDLTLALQMVDSRKETIKELEEVEDDIKEITEETAQFIITGKANIKLVEMLLKENEIKFIRR